MSSATYSHRDRLVRFYEHYNTDKLSNIDTILQSFEGNETAMFEALAARYGPEPEVVEHATPSLKREPTRTDAIRQLLVGSRGACEDTTHAADTTVAALPPTDAWTTPHDASAPLSQHTASHTATTPVSTRRQRGRPLVASDQVAAEELVRGLQQTSSSSLLHIHQRLQHMLSVMIQQDPSPYLEQILQRSSGALPPGDMLDTLQSITQFRSLAAAFVEECTPLVLHAEAVTGPHGSKAKRQDDKPPPTSPNEALPEAVLTSCTNAHQTEGGAVLPPEGTSDSVLAARISEGVLTLHPGQYFENLIVPPHAHLELRTSYVGAVVELHPLDPFHPIISIGPHAVLRVNGVRFVGGIASNGPLMHIHGTRVEVALQNCEFHEGGVVLQGMDATLRCSDCLFHRCAYAAIYAKSGCFVSIDTSSFEDGDSALRCRDATFAMSRCTISRSASDACVCHGSVEGTIESSEFDTGSENGMLLSPSSAVLLTDCTFHAFDRFGLYAPSGARFQLAQCQLDGNGLGPSNRAATGGWAPRRDANGNILQ